MSAERLRQAELDAGKPGRQPIPRRRQVAAHVDAGRKEIRQQHHAPGAPRHASRPAFVDIRLRQLQKGRLHQRMAAPHQLLDDVMQVVVGFRLSAAVGDQ